MIILRKIKAVYVFMLLVMVFNLVSCSGGGGGTQSGQQVTVALDSPQTIYAQQQIAHANVLNYALAESSYQGMIDGTTQVTIVKTSSTSFAWVMPTLADGNHTLKLSLAGQSMNLSFATQQVTLTQSPTTIFTNIIPNLTAALDTDIATLSGEAGQEATLSQYRELRTKLADAQVKFETLSPEDQKSVAAFIQQNLLSISQNANAVRKDSDKSILDLYKAVLADIVIMCASFALVNVVGVTPVGFIVGSVGFASGLVMFKQDSHAYVNACNDHEQMMRQKRETARDELEMGSSRLSTKALYKGEPISFDSNISKNLVIMSTYTLTDEFAAELGDVKSKITGLPSLLFSLLPSELRAWAGESTTMTSSPEQSSATTYRMQSVSDSNITGTASSGGDGNLQLLFKFVKVPTSSTPVPFTFTLLDTRDNHTSTFSATLKPPAVDHIEVTSDKTTINAGGTAILTAVSYADAAATIVVPTVATDYTWSITSGSGSVSANGSFTAGQTSEIVTVKCRHNVSGIEQAIKIEVQKNGTYHGTFLRSSCSCSPCVFEFSQPIENPIVSIPAEPGYFLVWSFWSTDYSKVQIPGGSVKTGSGYYELTVNFGASTISGVLVGRSDTCTATFDLSGHISWN